MWLLTVVSFIWAISPGLIKGQLSGLDPALVAAVRLGLALLVFVPFLRIRQLSPRSVLAYLGIGAVQFGLMYVAYNEAFRHLRAYEVVLFTITTPLFVTLLADALDRRFAPRNLGAALLAVAGAGIITFQPAQSPELLRGFLTMQLSNFAFALGQVGYKRWRARESAGRDHEVFGLTLAGAFLFALLVATARGVSLEVSPRQLWTLLYLGLVASALAFFLWNTGAQRVSDGRLAVMNNVKIPLGIACSLLLFGEEAHLGRLLAGGGIILLGMRLAESRRT